MDRLFVLTCALFNIFYVLDVEALPIQYINARKRKKFGNLPKVIYRLLVFVYLMFEGSIANSKCLSDWKWSKQSLSFPHWMKVTWNKAKNRTKSTKYKRTRKGKCKTQQEHITNIFCPQEIDYPFVFSILCVSNIFVVVVLMCFLVFFSTRSLSRALSLSFSSFILLVHSSHLYPSLHIFGYNQNSGLVFVYQFKCRIISTHEVGERKHKRKTKKKIKNFCNTL